MKIQSIKTSLSIIIAIIAGIGVSALAQNFAAPSSFSANSNTPKLLYSNSSTITETNQVKNGLLGIRGMVADPSMGQQTGTASNPTGLLLLQAIGGISRINNTLTGNMTVTNLAATQSATLYVCATAAGDLVICPPGVVPPTGTGVSTPPDDNDVEPLEQ
jgi:hypothetical protein